MSDHIENALIERTSLGYEDHGCLTFWLSLKFENFGQGFGGFALDAKPLDRNAGEQRGPHAIAGAFIAAILKAVGVERWEDVRGKHVRVRRERDQWGPIIAIGHIVDDRWFEPRSIIAQFERSAP